MLHIRMSLQIRTCMAQCHKIFLREKSALCKCGIISRCYMSFGQYKTVTILHLRVLWINIHLFEIQICKNICRRQRSARMTGFCAVLPLQCSYGFHSQAFPILNDSLFVLSSFKHKNSYIFIILFSPAMHAEELLHRYIPDLRQPALRWQSVSL